MGRLRPHRRLSVAIASASLIGAGASLTILRVILSSLEPRSLLPLLVALIMAPLLGALIGSVLLRVIVRLTGLDRDD